MPVNEQREETDEEFLARLAAMRAKRKAEAAAAAEAAKPKLQVVVTPKLAEAVKANPGSLRLSANGGGSDDCDRARASPRDRPTAQRGWPSAGCAGRRIDCATGEASIVEYRDGYPLRGGAISDYDPISALRRPEAE